MAFALVFNVRSVIRRRSLRLEDVPREMFLQLTVDLVTAGFLLAFTGGTKNPVFSLLFIHAALGALLLSGRYLFAFSSVLLAVVATSFFCRNLQIISGNFYANEVVPPAAVACSLAVVLLLVGWLANVLRGVRSSEQRQRQRDARLESLLASGALAADFCHRFATPLNNVLVRLNRARTRFSTGTDPSAELAAAESSVRQCESLLREIASTTFDTSASRFDSVDLKELVSQVIRRWSDSEPGVTVCFDDSEPHALIVRAPTILLSKALTNLLENSGHHQNRKGNIHVRVMKKGDNAVVTLRDEGPGWPDEMLHQGIRPFATTRPGGTGLGLHNTLSLCEALGGEFVISNSPAGGAMATLSLPIAEGGRS